MKTIALWSDLERTLGSLASLALRSAALFKHPTPPAPEPDAIPVVLPHGTLWRIEGRVRGLRLRCDHGRIWLTQTGRDADILLQPGQTCVIEQAGALLLQPLRDASGQPATRGTLLPAAGSRNLTLRLVSRSPVSSRVGHDVVAPDAGPFWETLVWTALAAAGCFTLAGWLSSLASFLATS